MQKTSIFGYLCQKGHFGQFLAKMGKTGIFFKKALGTFFSRFQVLTNCNVSEKSNERISRKAVANGQPDGQTDERTDGRTNVIT